MNQLSCPKDATTHDPVYVCVCALVFQFTLQQLRLTAYEKWGVAGRKSKAKQAEGSTCLQRRLQFGVTFNQQLVLLELFLELFLLLLPRKLANS